MRALAFILATLAACAPWTPEELPVTVDVGSSLSDDQRLALLDGMAMLEGPMGRRVFSPVETNGRHIQRGRIAVRSSGKPMAGRPGDGLSEVNHWSCEVRLATDVTPRLALHELMHCLGWHDHDSDPRSVMAELAGPDVQPAHVAFVRGMAGGR